MRHRVSPSADAVHYDAMQPAAAKKPLQGLQKKADSAVEAAAKGLPSGVPKQGLAAKAQQAAKQPLQGLQKKAAAAPEPAAPLQQVSDCPLGHHHPPCIQCERRLLCFQAGDAMGQQRPKSGSAAAWTAPRAATCRDAAAQMCRHAEEIAPPIAADPASFACRRRSRCPLPRTRWAAP